MEKIRYRIWWLKNGDANTNLFHLHSHHRKRKTFVAKLMDGDHILTSHGEKAAIVDQFYTNLIGNNTNIERVIYLEAIRLPRYDISDLEALFSE